MKGQQPVALALKGSLGGLDLTFAGAIEQPHKLNGLDLKVGARSGSLASVAALLHEKLNVAVPDLGWRSASASGQLRGSASRLEMTDAKLNLETALVALSAEGAVGDLNKLAGVNASFSARGGALGALLERLGDRAPAALALAGTFARRLFRRWNGRWDVTGRARSQAARGELRGCRRYPDPSQQCERDPKVATSRCR